MPSQKTAQAAIQGGWGHTLRLVLLILIAHTIIPAVAALGYHFYLG